MIDKTKLLGFKKDGYNPVIRPKTLELMLKILDMHKPKQLLEIGTYIGYSCSEILQNCPTCNVVTVEKDKNLAICATENLKNMGFSGRFSVWNMDAFDALEKLQAEKQKFDFIFLDGAKGQYLKYLPILKVLLNVGGVLMADDIMFHGYVEQDGTVKHKHRTIVTNLRKFLHEVKEDKDFQTQIFDFEDGVSVCIKKS